jgi:hypothetical protein
MTDGALMLLFRILNWRVSVAGCAFLTWACSGQSPEAAGAPAPSSTGVPSSQPPLATRFAGSYEVPVDLSLSAAAVFPIAELEWRIREAQASLSYDLPEELVGRTIRVDLAGDGQGETAHLTGESGTADCAISSNEVACNEVLSGLQPIDTDLATVKDLATRSFAGPAQQRVDVARQFAADPIGIVRINLQAPLPSD